MAYNPLWKMHLLPQWMTEPDMIGNYGFYEENPIFCFQKSILYTYAYNIGIILKIFMGSNSKGCVPISFMLDDIF